MYNVGVVGTAGAIVGGWGESCGGRGAGAMERDGRHSTPTPPPPLSLSGNLGGGLTHIAMPMFYDALIKHYGHTPVTAWRYAFYLPGALHLFMGLVVMLFGQDMPEGRTAAVRKVDNR